MRRAKLVVCFAIAIGLSPPIANADTPLDVLGVEKSVNDVARRAQETGDHIAAAFAQQALRVIAEWKKANADLIDKAFDRLDQQSQNFFRELNDTSIRLAHGEAVTFIDLQRSMATAGDVLAALPGVSEEPQVIFYWPTIVLPTGEPEINIHVIGSRIADANPTISFEDKTVPVKNLTDNEIGFDVHRESLRKDDKETKKSLFSLTYRVSASHWYNPFSWWTTEPRRRDIEISVLPLIPGTAKVIRHLLDETPETKVLGNILVGGHGKDNLDRYPYIITPLDQEEGWILDKAAQQKAQDEHEFNDNSGDGEGGSSCVGYDVNSFTDTSLLFMIQHGHKTGAFGHKSDANQNCRMWIHLKRLHKEEKDGTPESKPLDWQKDIPFDLAKNVTKCAISISLYTGVEYKIDNDREIPYGLFEILRSKESIKFRPRPQRDF